MVGERTWKDWNLRKVRIFRCDCEGDGEGEGEGEGDARAARSSWACVGRGGWDAIFWFGSDIGRPCLLFVFFFFFSSYLWVVLWPFDS